MRRQKKQGFGVNVGTSSIMLIFVILCLVSFAALSIVSAKVDYKLSEKLALRNTQYYQAVNKGEEFLASLDEELKAVYRSSADETEYFNIVGSESSFSIDLSDQQILEIKVNILYPSNPETDEFYSVKSWQVITLDNLELDDTLPLFTEEDFIF